MNSFVPGQLGQNLPLRAGQFQQPRLVFEAAAQQTRHIVQQKAKGFIGTGGGGHACLI